MIPPMFGGDIYNQVVKKAKPGNFVAPANMSPGPIAGPTMAGGYVKEKSPDLARVRRAFEKGFQKEAEKKKERYLRHVKKAFKHDFHREAEKEQRENLEK